MSYQAFLDLLPTLGLSTDDAQALAEAFIAVHGPAQDATNSLNSVTEAISGLGTGLANAQDVATSALSAFDAKLNEIKTNAATLANGDTGMEFSGEISHLQAYMTQLQSSVDYWTEYSKHYQGGGANLLAAQTQMEEAQKALAQLTADYAEYTKLEAQYSGHGKELLDLEKWYQQQH
jgi:ABC-type transporter Mla subunit MlaD